MCVSILTSEPYKDGLYSVIMVLHILIQQCRILYLIKKLIYLTGLNMKRQQYKCVDDFFTVFYVHI